MNLKRLLAAVGIACLLFCLIGCGEVKDVNQSGTGTTAAPTDTNASNAPTDQTTGEAVFDGYTVTVVDEGGNPISGAFVQLCLDSCFPGMTDASGVAKFDLEEAEYKVSFVNLPAGYDYVSEEHEFYFEDGSKEITITLKAVA